MNLYILIKARGFTAVKWSMVFHCVYGAYSEKRWVYGTVYTNDRKKCVYSKREDWIAGSEEKNSLSVFLLYPCLEGNYGIILNGML